MFWPFGGSATSYKYNTDIFALYKVEMANIFANTGLYSGSIPALLKAPLLTLEELYFNGI